VFGLKRHRRTGSPTPDGETTATEDHDAKARRWWLQPQWLDIAPAWLTLGLGVLTLFGVGGYAYTSQSSGRSTNTTASTGRPTTATNPATTTSTSTTSQAPTTSTGTTTPPSSTHETRLLDQNHIEVSESESGNFGTGLGIIAGVAFPNSIRQIYEECCSKTRGETFPVPAGFTHFAASIGLETGGIYKKEHSPSVLFEVFLGSGNNKVSDSIMVYNEPAEEIEVSVAGQRQILLETRIANPTVCEFEVCHADAIWGNARFTK
jgi:hypothetical protein